MLNTLFRVASVSELSMTGLTVTIWSLLNIAIQRQKKCRNYLPLHELCSRYQWFHLKWRHYQYFLLQSKWTKTINSVCLRQCLLWLRICSDGILMDNKSERVTDRQTDRDIQTLRYTKIWYQANWSGSNFHQKREGIEVTLEFWSISRTCFIPNFCFSSPPTRHRRFFGTFH